MQFTSPQDSGAGSDKNNKEFSKESPFSNRGMFSPVGEGRAGSSILSYQ